MSSRAVDFALYGVKSGWARIAMGCDKGRSRSCQTHINNLKVKIKGFAASSRGFY